MKIVSSTTPDPSSTPTTPAAPTVSAAPEAPGPAASASRDNRALERLFEDPVRKSLMVDPWVYSDGYTYERRTGEKLDLSPFTREPIYPMGPNVALRSELFEAYPKQAERFRNRKLDKRDEPRPPALSAAQQERLQTMQATLAASLQEVDGRAEQLRAALDELNKSELLATLKGQLAKDGRKHQVGYGLELTSRGLGPCGHPRAGLERYFNARKDRKFPPVDTFMDTVLDNLGQVAGRYCDAEGPSANRWSDYSGSSESESESDSDASGSEAELMQAHQAQVQRAQEMQARAVQRVQALQAQARQVIENAPRVEVVRAHAAMRDAILRAAQERAESRQAAVEVPAQAEAQAQMVAEPQGQREESNTSTPNGAVNGAPSAESGGHWAEIWADIAGRNPD